MSLQIKSIQLTGPTVAAAVAAAATAAAATTDAAATKLAAAEGKPPIETVATQPAEAAAPEARSQDLLAHHWMSLTDSAHKRIYSMCYI